MPSLRQKVTTYFRQLSFIADPRDGSRPNLNSRKTDSDGNFITKYLEGRTEERTYITPGPEIKSGRTPADLPDIPILPYPIGPNTITGACTGPDEGLTGIKRSKLHLSAGSDIDFIDTNQDQDLEIRKSISNHNKLKLQNTQNTQKYRGDQNANKTIITPTINNSIRSRKNSRTGLNTICSSSTTTTGGIQNQNLDTSSSNRQTNQMTTTVQMNSNHNNSTIVRPIIDDNLIEATIIVNMKKSPQSHLKYKTTTTNNKPKTDLFDMKTTGNTATMITPSTNLNNITTNIQTVLNTADSLSKDEKENSTPNIDNEQQQQTESIMKRDKLITTSCTHEKNNSTNIGSDDSGVRVTSFAGEIESVASVTNWKMESDNAYGISVSLYEHNMLTKESMGNPIADCYGLVVRGNVAAMAMADGVNWGDGARLAARSAVHGSLDYLDTAIFGISTDCSASSTRDVFVSLLRSLWEGHDCILEVGGALSTLTVAVILPLSDQYQGKYAVCACNVGDSLGYVYSKKYGVREFTQGSHDIASMRDMRDALGALGPVDGNKPELSNLTLSMTIVENGDIVFLTSDGISDNFDPVVGKFAEAWTSETKVRNLYNQQQQQPKQQLAPKRQNKSATTLNSRTSNINENATQYSANNLRQHKPITVTSSSSSASTSVVPVRPPRSKKQNPSLTEIQTPLIEKKTASLAAVPSRPKYMRSHTVIEPRVSVTLKNQQPCKFARSAAGLPLVTGPQRHTLTLLRLEDLLSYGINGQLCPCPSSRKLCHLLVDFVRMITSARRKTLEQRELFYKLAIGPDGVKREVEMNRLQHRSARKRVVDTSSFSALPGKLDHASVVAYTIGSGMQAKEFQETNF